MPVDDSCFASRAPPNAKDLPLNAKSAAPKCQGISAAAPTCQGMNVDNSRSGAGDSEARARTSSIGELTEAGDGPVVEGDWVTMKQ